MRPLSDTGMNANTRYAISKNVNGRILASSQVIRLFIKDHNKCHKVIDSKIKIEAEVNGKRERLWFTLWDEKIKYRYNGTQIRVRMSKKDTSVIYLFDPATDTYLGFINRDYEPAGDLANQKKEDKNYMYAHSARLKKMERRRSELLQGILADDQAESNEQFLHESLKTPMFLHDGNGDFKVLDADNEDSRKTAHTVNSESTKETIAITEDLAVIGQEELDEVSELLELTEIEN